MILKQMHAPPKLGIFLLITMVACVITACQPKRFYLPVVKSQPGIATPDEMKVIITSGPEPVATNPPLFLTPTPSTPNLMLPMVSKPLPRADLAWQIIPHTIQGNQGNYSLQLVIPQFSGETKDNLEPVTTQIQLLVNKLTDQFFDNVENAPETNLPGFSTLVYKVTSNTFWQPDQPIDPYIQLPQPLTGAQAVIPGNHNIISLLFVINSYFGGAHPYTIHEAVSYDLTEGRILTLQDLFSPGSEYLNFLSSYSINELSQRPGLPLEMINAGAEALSENYRIWNLTPFGLMITFEEYQVGPYAAGYQQVLIPYSTIAGYLDPAGPLSAIR